MAWGTPVSVSIIEEINVRKIPVTLFVNLLIVAAGLQLLFPVCSSAEEDQNRKAYYTIQIGTYISEDAAQRSYKNLAEKLNDSQLHGLRIEKIKKYYVVRIGRYDSKEDAERFYPELRDKTAAPPLVTKTRVGPETIIKQYMSKEERRKPAADLPPPKAAPGQSAAGEKGGQKETEPPPILTEKKKQIVLAPAENKEQKAAARLPEKQKITAAPPVQPESVKEQKKCGVKPVLVLIDESGSMLGMAKAAKADERAAGGPVSKVELQKQILERISPKLTASRCSFGIYRFRFFPGTHLLYEPLLKIDAHDPGYAKKIVRNYFTEDYEIYTRSSPITDVLQQLDIDILWKMSGSLTILLISDGVVTNIEPQNTANSQNQKNKETLLLAEVSWLKKKYGTALTIHSIYIANGNDENPDEEDAYRSLMEDIAELGGGSSFTGMDLLRNDRLMNELSAELCCGEN